MSGINFKREISDTFDHAIERATKALGSEGFGILTRIDMHSKIKEKTGKDIVPTVILGAQLLADLHAQGFVLGTAPA